MVVACVTPYLVINVDYRVSSNKWVLNTTETPLFFLWAQLAIAVLLFGVSDYMRLLPDRLTFDIATCRGLVPMVGLNVLGLRSVPVYTTQLCFSPLVASATTP